MSGLTATGFVRKTLQELRADLNASFMTVFGDVDTSDDSVLGQISGVLARPLSDLWELMELIYYSQAPASADGVQLDNVASLLGVVRLGETATRVNVVMYTEDIGGMPIAIPALTQVSMPSTHSAFQLQANTDINSTTAIDSLLYVSDATTSATYQIQINSNYYDCTANPGDTTNNVANTLYQALSADTVVTPYDWSNGHIRVLATDNNVPYSIAVTSGSGGQLDIVELGSLGEFECTSDGTVAAPANTITIIDTPVGSLDRVNNLDAGELGRELETDAELRIRRAASVQTGAGTIDAIRAEILNNVDNVSTCQVWENTSDSTSGTTGIPPHSIYVVATGGDSSDIATAIWQTKSAGIRTWGTTSVIVTDSEGNPQTVNFSRPTQKWAWVNVKYQIEAEEAYPGESTVRTAVKAAIKTYGDEFTIGENMIRDRYYKPIYSAGVAGISTISTLEIACMADGTSVPTGGDWKTTNINLNVDEIAVHELDHILVSEA